jgi:hypothetical protein
MKVAVQNTMITKGHVLAYGVAFVATIVATLLRMVLAPLVGTAVPFATYFVAVLLVVWYAGEKYIAAIAVVRSNQVRA